MTVIRSFLYLIQISAFYSVLCRIVCGSESDGHPQSVGATVVVGIAVVVDIAGIGRIARTHGEQPPVGPASSVTGPLDPVFPVICKNRVLHGLTGSPWSC